MMRGCKQCTLSPRACGLLRFDKGINTKERSQKYAQSLKMGGGVLEHLQANYLIDIMKTSGRVYIWLLNKEHKKTFKCFVSTSKNLFSPFYLMLP